MTPNQLAKQLVRDANLLSEDGQPEAVMIDYNGYFTGENKISFPDLQGELEKLGYECVPMEDSIIPLFSRFLKGKYVVQRAMKH